VEGFGEFRKDASELCSEELHWRKFVTNAETEWLLKVDGAARGNPSDAGCGAAIADESAV